MSRRLPVDAAVHLTDALVARLAHGAATGALETGPDGRRWYRDLGCKQHHVRVSAGRATYYRVSHANRRRIVEALGTYEEISVAEARRQCDRLRVGDKSHIRKRAAAGEITASEAWEMFATELAAGRYPPNKPSPRPSTLRSYQDTWRPHVEKAGHGSLTLTAFAGVVEGIHKGLTSKPGVANKFATIVRMLYRYARQRRLYAGPDPLVNKEGDRIGRIAIPSRRRFLSPSQVALMAEAAGRQPYPWRHYWLLAVLTGVRMGNLISARWADIDLGAGLWTLPETKAGQPVTIALQPEAVALLEEIRATNPAGCQWVFPNPTDTSRHRSRWLDSWAAIRSTVPELADTRPHDCRRTCGSLLTMAGVPLPVVGQQLGHAPGSAATHVYARLDITAQKQAAAKLGPVLGDALGNKRKRKGGS